MLILILFLFYVSKTFFGENIRFARFDLFTSLCQGLLSCIGTQLKSFGIGYKTNL